MNIKPVAALLRGMSPIHKALISCCNERDELRAEIERLLVYLRKISVMNSDADEEFDANTLEHAVFLAKQALAANDREIDEH